MNNYTINKKKESIDISVVIPVYGCKECLFQLYERLVASLEKIVESFEIIFVNDACPQNSWEVISEIARKDNRIVGINLSRNFGQIRAITAGLENSIGNYIVVMDCDLQDRPESIEILYNKLKEGYDVVFAKRIKRKHSFFNRQLSKLFYAIYSSLTGLKVDEDLCNFSINSRKVINNYLLLREQNRSFTLFIKWTGFNQTSVEIEGAERAEGKTSYNIIKKIKLALKIITAQSNNPLMFFVGFGFIISLISFVGIIYLILRYFISGIGVAGWTSTIVLILFIGGIILINLGIIGLYVGYIFNEIKKRPLYIVDEKINSKI